MYIPARQFVRKTIEEIGSGRPLKLWDVRDVLKMEAMATRIMNIGMSDVCVHPRDCSRTRQLP